jgi:putative serine protease PepD
MSQQDDHGQDRRPEARPDAASESTQEIWSAGQPTSEQPAAGQQPPSDQTRPTPMVSWFGPDDTDPRPGDQGQPPYAPQHGGPAYAQPYGAQHGGAYPAGAATGPATDPYGAPASGAGAAFGAGAGTTTRDRRGSRRRWVDMALAAVVAAVVAGGTTAGVLAADNTPQAPATTSTSSSRPAGTSAGPVVQARGGSSIDWGAVAGAVEPSVVAISINSDTGGGEGSGVILDNKGRVLTNNHVATAGGQGGSLTVTLFDGRTYDATIVGTDASTDLAVIQMKGATNLTPATLGDSSAVKVGAAVMAVGNPLGLAGTVTTGIVSALDRPVTTSSEDQSGSGDPVVTNAIQTDAAVNPGNSGGALVDANGRVIGIPSSIASLGQSIGGSQSGSIGLGFSIPINEAKSIADQLISKGKAEHPFLGVTLRDGDVQQGSAKRSAAVVQNVTSGTPAASAGLQNGDAITAVNGDQVNGSESLVAQIREKSVGDKVELTLSRGGKQQQVTVTLTSRPSGQ